jgi:hypothetical protein
MGRKLWDGLAKSAGLPRGRRYGWHSLHRKFTTELKEIPLKGLCHWVLASLIVLFAGLGPRYARWTERVSARRSRQVLVHAPAVLLTVAALRFPGGA